MKIQLPDKMELIVLIVKNTYKDMDYIQLAFDAIYECKRDNMRQSPNYLVMHPETWYKLCEQESKNHNSHTNLNDPFPKFMGITVYRSYDITEDKILYGL